MFLNCLTIFVWKAFVLWAKCWPDSCSDKSCFGPDMTFAVDWASIVYVQCGTWNNQKQKQTTCFQFLIVLKAWKWQTTHNYYLQLSMNCKKKTRCAKHCLQGHGIFKTRTTVTSMLNNLDTIITGFPQRFHFKSPELSPNIILSPEITVMVSWT